MYVKITPSHDLSHSPTLTSLFLRHSASVTATKMLNTELLMRYLKNHFICFSLNYSHTILSASFSPSQYVQVCFSCHYFVVVNSTEAETAVIILFGARSNSAQHHTLPKRSSSLFLVPLGEQPNGSHLKKSRYSPVHHSRHLIAIIKPKKSHTCHRTI